MGRKIVDLTGKKFGKLLVISQSRRVGREFIWLCRCDCGNEKECRGGNLKQGSAKSCGCNKDHYKNIAENRVIDLKGRRFGRLVVISRQETEKRGAYWLCCCDCGNSKTVPSKVLLSGDSQSCGCKHKDAVTSHGASSHTLYGTWTDMIARCHDEKNDAYKFYGAAGINVCDYWRESPHNFFSDMGDRPKGFTLERKNGSLGYCKENCIWASQSTQQNNRRNNAWFLHSGSVYNCKQLCARLGLGYNAVKARIHRGGSLQEVFGCDVTRLNYQSAMEIKHGITT